jgi:dihydroorotase (multifunctional complex type)
VSQRLLLQDATLADGQRASILVEGERIAAVGQLPVPSDAQLVDAAGLLALPGLVDVHVHLREPGGEHKEDFTTGTSAALAGGVTTVLAMPNTNPPLVDQASMAHALALASQKAVCDYGLFAGATPDNGAEVAALENAVGLKAYAGSSTGTLLVDSFPAQYAHFSTYPHDRVLAVHAEDEEAVRWFAAHGQRRPPICAALGVTRAIALAEHLGRRLHICHVSTAHEVALIKAAKARGVRVTCEATPHHLFLTSENEANPLYRMNPPLRADEDVKALWQNLDVFDAIATDHAPHTLEEKAGAEPPAGVPGLETMLPLLLTAARQNRLTLADVVRLTAADPARIFGLAGKGQLAPGYDADIVLIDPDAEWTVSNDGLFTKCAWTPFAGWRVRGRVQRVFLRGQLAYEHGRVLARPSAGRRVVQRKP